MGTINDERAQLVDQLFLQHDHKMTGTLNAYQLQEIHQDMRLGGISIPQVQASIAYTCIEDDCEKEELFDVLQEMDRRYFLIQNLRWEFSMMDYGKTDTITEEAARWLTEAVHDNAFSKRKWEKFLRSRAVPGSGVSFAEIEVMLCDIPNILDVLDEDLAEEKEREERARKEQELERRLKIERDRIKKQREAEKKSKEEDDRRKKAEADKRRQEEETERLEKQKQKEDEEKRRKELEEEEERGRKEAEERERKIKEEKELEEKAKEQELMEMKRLKEMQERAAIEQERQRLREEEEAKGDEEILKQAITEEKDSAEKMEEARKKVQTAKDARSKKEHEEEENKQKLRHKGARVKRVRYQLKVSYKKRDRETLPKAAKEFTDAKLPDDELDLEKAEKVLKEWRARDNLKTAMESRLLKTLESAVNYVKRNGFEPQLAREMIEANRILFQLRRLERIRAEILELKQSTVAEIRSYSKPPAIVHTVMIATFLLHGHREKETKDWKTIQALVGKTGKEGLKRRCLECEPAKLNPDAAARAKLLLSAFELDHVREVSAGAATFYNWSQTMIEAFEAKAEADPEIQEEKTEAKSKNGNLKKRRASKSGSSERGK